MNILKLKPYFWINPIKYIITAYHITSDAVNIRTGLLNIHTENIQFHRVLDIASSESLIQRLFNCGTIELVSTDKTSPIATIDNVRNVEKLIILLKRLIEKNREGTQKIEFIQ